MWGTQLGSYTQNEGLCALVCERRNRRESQPEFCSFRKARVSQYMHTIVTRYPSDMGQTLCSVLVRQALGDLCQECLTRFPGRGVQVTSGVVATIDIDRGCSDRFLTQHKKSSDSFHRSLPFCSNNDNFLRPILAPHRVLGPKKIKAHID